jgi:hypothetical protein
MRYYEEFKRKDKKESINTVLSVHNGIARGCKFERGVQVRNEFRTWRMEDLLPYIDTFCRPVSESEARIIHPEFFTQ